MSSLAQQQAEALRQQQLELQRAASKPTPNIFGGIGAALSQPQPIILAPIPRRCRWGFHRWGEWEGIITLTHYIQQFGCANAEVKSDAQQRVCIGCNKIQRQRI